jgi:hypothetical protein
VDEEQSSAADASRVANVCEAVVMLAGAGGMDVVAARRLVLDFDPSGDVTVTLTTTDGATDEATITAADIRAASDLDADHERESTPPPPAA